MPCHEVRCETGQRRHLSRRHVFGYHSVRRAGTRACRIHCMRLSACMMFSLVAVVAGSGCSSTSAHWVPPDRACPGALRPVWVADSSLTICVVTSFRTHDLRTWTRERPGRAPDVFEIQTAVTPTQTTLTGGWPPRLAVPNSRGTSGSTHIDSISVREDTVAGYPAHTEVGVVRDTTSPDENRSVFISGWTASDSSRSVAKGSSTSRATLDTLLLMLHSARPWRRSADTAGTRQPARR